MISRPFTQLPMSDTQWPADDLEALGHCPICHDTARTVAYDNLTDTLFQCAPGRWTLHACTGCGTAYLDPRPTATSIGKAYTTYCTHPHATGSEKSTAYSWRSAFRKFAHASMNSYRNARWQMHLTPSNNWGRLLVTPLFPLRALIEQQMRNMPPPPAGRQGRLLDVGSGNGGFLKMAEAAGWSAHGIDFDPVAVAESRRQGLAVDLGDFDRLKAQAQSYDWITCSHVLEHVHEPQKLLQLLHSLLTPGGTLWLQTPNLDSIGHKTYGSQWVGIDPPRHLTLLTLRSLRDTLENAGFKTEFHRLPCLSAMAFYAASSALRGGEKNVMGLPYTRILRPFFLLLALRQRARLSNAEFHTVIATR